MEPAESEMPDVFESQDVAPQNPVPVPALNKEAPLISTDNLFSDAQLQNNQFEVPFQLQIGDRQADSQETSVGSNEVGSNE